MIWIVLLVTARASSLISNWVSYIEYGDRAIFWKDQINLNLLVWNMVQGLLNEEIRGITIEWTCTDLSTQKLCVSAYGEELTWDSYNYTVFIPEQTLAPLRSYQFDVELNGAYNKTHSVILYSSQNQVPLLSLMFPMSIMSRYVNFDEYVDFKINLDPGFAPDDVKIMANIQIGGYVEEVQLLYPKLHFSASRYLKKPPTGEDLNCKIQFNMIVPGFLEPAFQTIEFKINAPPKRGVIVGPTTARVSEQSTFTLQGASDIHGPLTYQFSIYLTQEQFDRDLLTRQQQYMIQLTEFTDSQSITTMLPYGNITIVVSARDAMGATQAFYYPMLVELDGTDIKQLAQQITEETDVTKLIVKSIILAQLYNRMPLRTQVDEYSIVTNSTLEFIKTKQQTMTIVSTCYQTNLRKAVWILEGTGVAFKANKTIDGQLGYILEMETEYRKTAVQLVKDIQLARTNLEYGQLLGNVTAQDKYNYISNQQQFFIGYLDGVYGTLDFFLGRMDVDTVYFYEDELSKNKSLAETALNGSSIKEIFDNMTTTNNGRLLGQVERTDIQPDNEYIIQYRSELELTGDLLDLLHVCYTRVLSLVHLINLISNELVETNGEPFRYKSDYFNFYFNKVTLSKIEQILVRNNYAISFYSQDTLNYSQSAAYSGVWNINNDTINLSVQVDDEDEDESNFMSNRNILMWENRDYFTDQDALKSFTLHPGLLYLVSVVLMPVNPYYWRNEIYNYSKWNSYTKEQLYVSPQIILQNGSDIVTVKKIENYGFSYSFVSDSMDYNNTRCANIVSNFTEGNCTQQIIGDKMICYCEYLSDFVLLQRYIEPDLRRILYVTTDNMYLTIIGQVVFIMTITFFLFMIVSQILDIRALKVAPSMGITPEENNYDPDALEINESMQVGKPFDQTMIEKSKISNVIPQHRKPTTEKDQLNTDKQLITKPNLIDQIQESKSVVFKETARLRPSKFKVLQLKKNTHYDIIDNDMAEVACQYEPIFDSNLELGIKYTSADLIISGIFKLQELMSVFIYYDINSSRLSRMLSIYMKLMVMFVVSSYTIEYFNTVEHIAMVIFVGECSVFFINVVKAELNGTICEKIIGIILTLGVLAGCWIYYFFEVSGLDIDIADNWARQFIISYLTNHFIFDPIVVVFKILLYPWTLKQMVAKTQAPMAYLLYFLINHADIRTLYTL